MGRVVTTRDPIADLLDAIATDQRVIDAVRAEALDANGEQLAMPDVRDAFWLRRARIALYSDAQQAGRALEAIEARRHGKPPERVEHSGGLSVRVDPRDLSDEQLAAIVASSARAKP